MMWIELMMSDLQAQVTDRYVSPGALESERSEHEGPPLEVGWFVAKAIMDATLMVAPSEDALLAGWLADHAARVPVSSVRRGMIVRHPSGRLCVWAGSGRVIDSDGVSLCLVEGATASDYRAAWAVPGMTRSTIR